MAVPYLFPQHWIIYGFADVGEDLVEAKATILALKATPFQRDWVVEMQRLQLKMEVAGTSRIEGAEFTDRELEEALQESGPRLRTRSQRQANAAAHTYRWITQVPDERPIDESLICEVHRRIVTGCDDDHCPPGRLRGRDENVTFGYPRHRGCEGGQACQRAFSNLAQAVGREFRSHDPLIQAMALQYHFAAMHPFLDGNGRTARALEALLLQRAGLRDTAFVAMSNYYYEEKEAYLSVLAEVRARNHDLTPFIRFGLRGIIQQCGRLLLDIRKNTQKAMFRNMMYGLFGRLRSPKKRVIAERQVNILKVLLEVDFLKLSDLLRQSLYLYQGLKNPARAHRRDLWELLHLEAIRIRRIEDNADLVEINLDWPSQMTANDFMERIKRLPKAKTHAFL
jgi:Fic family protein